MASQNTIDKSRWFLLHRRRMQIVLASLFVLIGLYIASGSGLLATFSSAGQAYSDVPSSHYAYEHVQRLHAEGVLGNVECSSGKFCPADALDRQTAAVWIIRTVMDEQPATVSNSRFSDVNAGDWKAKYIEEFAERGITSGCGDDENGGRKFCPDNNILRKHMAIFITRAFDLPPAPDAGFEDVRSGTYFDSINRLAGAGITTGCGGTNFCPDRVINRAQAAIMLGRALEWRDGPVEPEPESDTTPPNIYVDFDHMSPALAARSDETVTNWQHIGPYPNECTQRGFTRGLKPGSRVSLDANNNGKWYCFRAQDAAGNWGFKSRQAPDDAVQDTRAPKITVSFQSAGPSLSARADETVSNWAHIGPLISSQCTSVSFIRGTQPGSSVALGANDNGKWYCFRARDAAGNWGFKSRQAPDDAVQDTRALDIIETSKYPTAEEFLADLGISFKKDAPGLTRDNVIALYEPYLTERGNKILNRLQFYEAPSQEELLERGGFCGRCFYNGIPYALYPSPKPRPDGWSTEAEWPIGGRHRRAENELHTAIHEVSHGFDYDNGDPDSYFSYHKDDIEGTGSLRQAFRKFYADPPTSEEWTGFRHPTKPDVCVFVDYESIFFFGLGGGYLGVGASTASAGENYIIDRNIYHVNPDVDLGFRPAQEVAADLPLYVKNLSPELEAHYSLFFKDRHKIMQIVWALGMHNYNSATRTTNVGFAEEPCLSAVQNASSSHSESSARPPIQTPTTLNSTEVLKTSTWVRGENRILSAQPQLDVANIIIDDTWASVALAEDASCDETAFEDVDEINQGSEVANPQAGTQYCFRVQNEEGVTNYINALIADAGGIVLSNPETTEVSLAELDADNTNSKLIIIIAAAGIVLLAAVAVIFISIRRGSGQPKFR